MNESMVAYEELVIQINNLLEIGGDAVTNAIDGLIRARIKEYHETIPKPEIGKESTHAD